VNVSVSAVPQLHSVAELARTRAAPPRPVIIDIRWEVGRPALYSDFLAGHVPGAQFCDLDADLADPPGVKGRHPLPDHGRLQHRLRAWGIDEGTPVVVYDGGRSIAASRAWWVLRWAGLADVRVLDGGFAAWQRAGLPVETGTAVPPVRCGNTTVTPGSMPVMTAEDALRYAAAGRLFDVRVPERYRGETEPIDRVAGHIPGARNLPMTENVDAQSRFRSGAELRQQFAVAGIEDGEEVGVYCGSGVTASQTVLAMAIAGRTARLYPGSWSEWIADPARPVATGEEPG
jgi:thiosulfate/3-mercaptopyruvate sulfurtransferase